MASEDVVSNPDITTSQIFINAMDKSLEKVLLDMLNEDLWYRTQKDREANRYPLSTTLLEDGTYRQIDKSFGAPIITKAHSRSQRLPDGKIDVILEGEHILGEWLLGYEFHYILEPKDNGTMVVTLTGLKGLPYLLRKLLIPIFKKELEEKIKGLKQDVESGVFNHIIFADEG